jgi:ligand-binding sensor domain-containing protein
MKLLTSIFACCFLFLRNALVLFLLSLSTTLFAQDANWKRYASGNTRAVTALVTEGNNVWAGMNHNLHHFDGTTWIEYNKTNSPMGIYPINCIAVSKKGDKYIGTAGGGVFKLSRDGSWSNINVTRARELPILCYQPTNLLVTTNDVIGLTVNNNNELVIIHSLSIYGIVQKEFVHISTYVDGRFMQSSVQRLSYSGNSFSADRVSLAFINDTLLMRDGYAMVQYTNNNLCRSSGSGYRRGLSNSPFDIYKGKIIYSDWNSIYILPTSYNDNTIAESYPYPREANCEVFYKNDFAVGDTAGLSIKNGFTWATYNTSNSAIPSNNVTQLARDSSGHLWLGTDNGIAKWDGTTMTAYFTNQIQNNFYFPAMSSPSFMVMDNAGDLWLTKYFNNNAKLHLDLCSSSWVGTGTPMWHSTGIVKGNNGNIWICSNGLQGPIKEFNGSNWTTHLNKNFTCIAKAPNGDIWAGSERHPDDINSDGIGLFRYNGSTWVTYNSSNSNIRTTNIYDMVFASTGKAWLSTEGGIATFDGTNWILYSLAGGRRNQALVDNSDNYWFAKTNMLKKFNGTTLTDYPVPSGNIACIAKDNNDIWVGTDNYKLYKFSIATNTWQQINIGLAGTGAISTIYIDPQGTKWLSNNEYLLQYHENGIQKGGLSITSSNLSLFLPCGTNANSGSVTVQALHGTLPYSCNFHRKI